MCLSDYNKLEFGYSMSPSYPQSIIPSAHSEISIFYDLLKICFEIYIFNPCTVFPDDLDRGKIYLKTVSKGGKLNLHLKLYY